MNVLHVINSCSGGATLSTLELIRTMRTMGVQSSILAMDNGSEGEKNLIIKAAQGRVLFIPLYWMNKKIRAMWWKRPLIELYWLWRTRKGYRYQKQIQQFIQKNDIEIIHTSTSLTPEGAIAAKAMGIPHVWHIRELIGPEYPFQFQDYASFGKFVTQYATTVVANSKATRHAIARYVTPSRIVYVPNAIDITTMPVKSARNSSLVVAMVGNVTSKMKNHAFFIALCGKLSSVAPVKFHIYGNLPAQDDAYLKALQEEVKKFNLEDKFYFKGYVSDPVTIMDEIDILVHPTGKESFGRIFLEALASGVPVVAVKGGGALEMIEDGRNGYLITEGDVDQAVERVKTLITDPELRRTFGENGRKLVEKEFSLDILASRIKEVYEKSILSLR